MILNILCVYFFQFNQSKLNDLTNCDDNFSVDSFELYFLKPYDEGKKLSYVIPICVSFQCLDFEKVQSLEFLR